MTNTPSTSTETQFITQAFPEPPVIVKHALNLLELARNGTKEQKQELPPITEISKPWIPSSCTETLRAAIYGWLESVAIWINREYTWQRDHVIPACWIHHPHIVNELAPLAIQRWNAENAADTAPIEDWHRYSLPQFLDRMRQRLVRACDKDHEQWPGRNRAAEHTSENLVEDRQTTIELDRHEGLLHPRHTDRGDNPAWSNELDHAYRQRLDDEHT